MSTKINTTIEKNEKDKQQDLNNDKKKQEIDALRKTLNELRASKGFRELGDMLYLDD